MYVYAVESRHTNWYIGVKHTKIIDSLFENRWITLKENRTGK